MSGAVSTTPPPSTMPAGGPFAAQHFALEGKLRACLARLDDVLRVLHTEASSASAAAAGIGWTGSAALAFAAISEGTETTRAVLIDTAQAATGSYVAAMTSVTATK